MRAYILLNLYIWNLRTQGGPVTLLDLLHVWSICQPTY